jgi:hypothetical protein
MFTPFVKTGDRPRFLLFCGQVALNQFLQRHALNNQRANSAQTYVCCDGEAVVGFYSLTLDSVDHPSVPGPVMKGLARHPGPLMILARLAEEFNASGRGRGFREGRWRTR